MKKALIISDTHIGDGSSRDPWIINPDLYALFFHILVTHLDMLRSKDLILILNGDIFELWGFRAENVFNSDLTKRFIDLLRWIDVPVYYNYGNHDEYLKDQYREHFPDNVIISDMSNLEGEEYTYRFLHGNIFDKYNSEYSWVGRGATKAAKYLGKINRKLETGIKSLASRVGRAGRYSSGRISDSVNYALRHHVCLVTGHTHRYRKDENNVYHDSGTFLREDYLIIDLK